MSSRGHNWQLTVRFRDLEQVCGHSPPKPEAIAGGGALSTHGPRAEDAAYRRTA
jgi:hypothetical protein